MNVLQFAFFSMSHFIHFRIFNSLKVLFKFGRLENGHRYEVPSQETKDIDRTKKTHTHTNLMEQKRLAFLVPFIHSYAKFIGECMKI